LHTTEHREKVKALLYQQLSQSVNITAISYRTTSLNQLTNHATLKARVGHLLPSQTFDSGDPQAAINQAVDEEQRLPTGWKLFYTKTPRKRPFYFNAKLDRSQWHRPTSDSEIELPPGWTVHRTKTPKQRVFFFNKALNLTQWELPSK
jgi:hypothetical protein